MDDPIDPTTLGPAPTGPDAAAVATAKEKEAIEKALSDVSRSANSRIVISAAVILTIMFTIALFLTDYVGFSRGFSFFSRLITGQDVTADTVQSDTIYTNLLPRYQEIDNSIEQIDLISSRITSITIYVEIVTRYLMQAKEADENGTNLFSGFVSALKTQEPDSSYLMSCRTRNVPFYVEANIPYQSDAGVYNITPSFSFCQFGTDPIKEVEVKFPTVQFTLNAPVISAPHALNYVRNQDLVIGLTELQAALRLELDRHTTLSENAARSLETAKSATTQAIAQNLALSKVNIGQDVAFIVSRAFLLVALVSLAATSLRIILNEIRFSNRISELRIASGYARLHAKPEILSNLYRSQTRDGEISKADADAGLSSKDVKEMLTQMIEAVTRK